MIFKSIVAGTGVAALCVLGFIFNADEYIEAAWQRLGSRVPVAVEIERLEVLLKKNDAELATGRRVKAEMGLKVRKAHQELTEKKEQLAENRGQMELIRSKLPGGNSFCNSVDQVGLAKTLRTRLERYQQQAETVSRMEIAVAKLEASYSQLEETLEARRQERDDLAGRLAVIRTDQAILGLAAGGVGKLPSTDTLARGQALAEKLEDQLAVEQEMSEAPTDAIDRFLADGEDDMNVLAEFDSFFSEASARTASHIN